jgi:integrase
MSRRKRRSSGWAFQRERADGSKMWYVGYRVNGRKMREATGCTKPARANGKPPKEVEDVLRERMNELDAGRWVSPSKTLTFDDLLSLVEASWRARGKKSRLKTRTGRDVSNIKHLREAFGNVGDARDITAIVLNRYSTRRLDEGAAVSTVRNELNIVKRGMRLAHELGQLPKVPTFPVLVPTNVRTGFFERHELDAMLAVLPDHVRPIVLFLYHTGWRVGEALSRQWHHVDMKAGVIRLERGEMKNGQGRSFPFAEHPELSAMIEAQREHTRQIERRSVQVVPWLFHRGGRQLKGFRAAWRTACRKTGNKKIPHDLRRTAVRNLVRTGTTERVAMKLTGHLTRSVFDRYNIVDDRDERAAVQRLAAAAPDRSVIPLADPYRTRGAAGA